MNCSSSSLHISLFTRARGSICFTWGQSFCADCLRNPCFVVSFNGSNFKKGPFFHINCTHHVDQSKKLFHSDRRFSTLQLLRQFGKVLLRFAKVVTFNQETWLDWEEEDMFLTFEPTFENASDCVRMLMRWLPVVRLATWSTSVNADVISICSSTSNISTSTWSGVIITVVHLHLFCWWLQKQEVFALLEDSSSTRLTAPVCNTCCNICCCCELWEP